MLVQDAPHLGESARDAEHGVGLEACRAWQERRAFWTGQHEPFDVVIIGGGVQGACLYNRLVREGRRVLLTDRGDFGGGTSQASAMLVWGGLLYLKNLDVASVATLCAARDRMIRERPADVEVRRLSFLFGERPHRRPWLVRSALELYWLLGLARRARPGRPASLPERAFVRAESARECLTFEEAQLRHSDAQFVMDWILAQRRLAGGGAAMNYCEVVQEESGWDGGLWTIQLRDALGEGGARVRTRCVVNAAGAWADRINGSFKIDSPWRHVLAKGTSITVARPHGHESVLVFDDGGECEGLSLVPWGPVSLWGSTERLAASPDDGSRADASEVAFLLDSLNRHLASPVSVRGVIALRSGVRTIVARRDDADASPLGLSKRWRVWRHPTRPWISVYGGKLTSCRSIASRAATLLDGVIRPVSGSSGAPCRDHARIDNDESRTPPMGVVAGVRAPSARWCAEHRMCWTLEDYLRRRTSIAQWVPRAGLGTDGEHAPGLRTIAHALARPGCGATEMLRRYTDGVVRNHDRVLGAIGDTGTCP